MRRTMLLVACGLGMLTAPGVVRGEDRRDPAAFVEEADAFKAELLKRAGAKGGRPVVPRRVLRMDLSGVDRPASPGEFRQAWHQPPISQDLTSQCWAFGSTSFLESEIHRLSGRELRLSEAWAVYWDHVEKARRVVRRRGDSNFSHGSEPNSSLDVWQRSGLVPASAYPGTVPGRNYHDDRRMYAEMTAYLDSCRGRGQWDEPRAIAAIRAILDRYMGRPPETVEADGVRMTPQEYWSRVVRVNAGEYISLMSFMQSPWNRWCRLEVPDNWWGSEAYYNVTIDELVRVIREAAESGQSVCLTADVTEPGFCFMQDVAMVPSFDIPSRFIDDAARELRFFNESTTDDHIVHVVGHQVRSGRHWYLVKDSDTRPRNGHHGGYMFYDEDYIRLKGLAAMLPRAVVERILGRSLGPVPPERPDGRPAGGSAPRP